jgi:hypothetical protein
MRVGEAVASSVEPWLVRSDAWIVAAILHRRDRWQRIDTLLSRADYLNTSIPTYDHISYGLPRLVARGLVATSQDSNGQLLVGATDTARRLGSNGHEPGRSRGEYLAGFYRELGCRPYPMEEAEDRSLGRVSNFSEGDFETALARYQSSSRKWGRVAGLLGGILRRYFRWRYPNEES